MRSRRLRVFSILFQCNTAKKLYIWTEACTPMLKTILVASDLSTRSKPAVQRGVLLAKAHGARLCVLNVVNDDFSGDRIYAEVARIEHDLATQVECLGKPADFEVAVRGGHAFKTISEEAHARAADLIVMGAHRRQVLRDIFAGTTIERVTHTAGRPVLIANSKTGERWQKVLVTIDRSDVSRDAARTAHRLGFLKNVTVSFTYGYAPVTRHMMTHAGIPGERIRQETEREFQAARKDLSKFVERLGLSELSYNAHVFEGVGAEVIEDLVQDSRADLLVIGTRGLSGVQRLFFGSVAQNLMARLDIDILAVPPVDWASELQVQLL